MKKFVQGCLEINVLDSYVGADSRLLKMFAPKIFKENFILPVVRKCFL